MTIAPWFVLVAVSFIVFHIVIIGHQSVFFVSHGRFVFMPVAWNGTELEDFGGRNDWNCIVGRTSRKGFFYHHHREKANKNTLYIHAWGHFDVDLTLVERFRFIFQILSSPLFNVKLYGSGSWCRWYCMFVISAIAKLNNRVARSCPRTYDERELIWDETETLSDSTIITTQIIMINLLLICENVSATQSESAKARSATLLRLQNIDRKSTSITKYRISNWRHQPQVVMQNVGRSNMWYEKKHAEKKKEADRQKNRAVVSQYYCAQILKREKVKMVCNAHKMYNSLVTTLYEIIVINPIFRFIMIRQNTVLCVPYAVPTLFQMNAHSFEMYRTSPFFAFLLFSSCSVIWRYIKSHNRIQMHKIRKWTNEPRKELEFLIATAVYTTYYIIWWQYMRIVSIYSTLFL